MFNLKIPNSIKIHCLVFNCDIQDDRVHDDTVPSLLKAISERSRGIYEDIKLDKGELFYRNAISKIVTESYSNFDAKLICAHFTSPIQIFPNPNIVLQHSSTYNPNIHGLFPKVISIVGFSPLKKMSSIPTLSRHIILPTLGSELNNFIQILNESLRVEQMVAIGYLTNSWFAVLTSFSDKEKSGRLQLPKN